MLFRSKRCFIVLVSLFVMAPALAQNAVGYGMGVSSATGALRNTCVSFVPPAADPTAAPASAFAGKSFQYQYRAIENIEDLREALEVSASSSLRGLWGSASLAASYFKSVQVNQYDLTMLIIARILNEPISINAEPNDAALKSGNKKLTAAQIFIKCGDEYISALQHGGSIHTFLVVNTRSRAERERLRTELSGSFNAGLEVSASAQRNVDRILRNNSYYMTSFQEGGDSSVGVPPKLGIDGFFEWARLAEKNILAHPTIMRVETKQLTSVYPGIKLPSAAAQRNVLRRLEDLSVAAEGRRKNLAFIARNLHRFPSTDADTTKRSLDTAADLLKEAQYLADDCYRDVTLCSNSELANLTSNWQAIAATSLPKEDPLYGVFDFATFDPAPRAFYRNAGCPERWSWALQLGDVDITSKNTKLNYEFTCHRTGYCYDCGGGWDCATPDPRPTWSGKVTADLAVVGDTVQVTNVVSPGNSYDAACEAPLMEFIKLRNGALIKE